MTTLAERQIRDTGLGEQLEEDLHRVGQPTVRMGVVLSISSPTADVDGGDRAGHGRADIVRGLHRLDDGDDPALLDPVADPARMSTTSTAPAKVE
jgi:hypothetical protein